jgi:Ser/Thr protein kinase RdoA (MazF antagonist)
MWGEQETQFFYHLNPDIILHAVEELGLNTTGRCLALNSMENRVYEIEIEDDNHGQFIVAKFYRPGRWTKQQILDEHEFLFDLIEAEIPALAPLKFNGESLFKLKDHELYYSLTPKKGGRIPQEFNDEQLEIMGRLIARMHNVGASKKSDTRIKISPETYGKQNLNFLLENKYIPSHLEASYKAAVDEICELSAPLFQKASSHRIHGDCHWGNIIWREEEGPFLVDFDDMLVGPAVQDVWLVIPGDDQQAKIDRSIFLEAYEELREFNYSELKLIEPLRALRFIHFSAWIAKRWEDPAFQNAFVHFASPHYWDEQLNDLRIQIDKIKREQDNSPFLY